MTTECPKITTWGCDEGYDLDDRPYPPKCLTCRDRGIIVVQGQDQDCEADGPCPDCRHG